MYSTSSSQLSQFHERTINNSAIVMSALVGDRQGKQIEIHAAVSVSITRGYVMIIEGTVPLHNSGPEGGPLRNSPRPEMVKAAVDTAR